MGITAETTRSLTRPSKLRQPCSVDWTPNLHGVKFNGTNEYGDTGFQPDIMTAGATMSFWAKMDDFSGSQVLGCWNNPSGKRFYVGFSNALAFFGVGDSYKNTTDISSYVSVGTWHHYCVTANGGTATFYIDGVSRDTDSYTVDAADNPDTAFLIGDLTGDGNYAMAGYIDEVAIFPRALLASDITAIYNNGRPRDLTKYNPVGWWRLGDTVDGSGATVPDLGYGKNDATLVNIPLYKQATASTYSDYSITFNGSDEYMTTTSADDTLATKSYSFWVKSDDTAVYGIFDHGDTPTAGVGGLHFNDGGYPLLFLHASGGAGYMYANWEDNAAQDDGNWHHWTLVLVYDDMSACKLYCDGVLQSMYGTPVPASGGSAAAYITGIRLGRAGTRYFDGSLDEFAVFDGELSSATINEIYAEGIPGSLTGHSPEHWWRMGEDDGGTGTIVTDAATPGLGAELIANGTMEADANWNNEGVYTTQTRSDEFTHSGTYSRKVVTGAGSAGVKSDTFSVTAGKTYQIEFWSYKVATGGSILCYLTDGDGAHLSEHWIELSTTTGSWQYRKFFSHPETTGSSSYVKFTQNGVTGSTYYIDDVTVKEVNGAPGVLVNAPTSSRSTPAEDASYNHRSISFNGSDEYMTTGADATVGTRSYSFWAKSDLTTSNGVFDHDTITSGYSEKGAFYFNQSSGKPFLYLDSHYYQYWVDNAAQDDGAWHHHVVYIEHDNIANCKWYVDGAVQTVNNNQDSGSANAYAGGLRIGRGSAYEFDGSLSDFAVFEGELSAATVTAIYNNGVPADLSKHSPRNWWRMGEGDDTGSASITDIGSLQAEPTEIVTNGAFDTDASGWTSDYSPTLSSEGGRLKMVNSASVGIVRQAVTVAVGKSYEVSAELIPSAGTATDLRFLLGTSTYGTQYYDSGAITGDTTITRTITATTTGLYLDLRNASAASSIAYFDNVSVKRVDKGNHGSLVNAPTFSTDSP
jgi:hypothetical protein